MGLFCDLRFSEFLRLQFLNFVTQRLHAVASAVQSMVEAVLDAGGVDADRWRTGRRKSPRGSWLGQLAALLACMPLKTRVSVIDGLETGQAFELLPTAMQRETMRELLKEEM